ARGFDPVRESADGEPGVEPNRTTGYRLVSRGARYLLELERRGEPDVAAEVAGRWPCCRADLPAVSQPRRAPRQPGHEAFRRRAADAGDRPHPAHRCAPAAARRADRGPGPRDRPAERPYYRPAEGPGLHDPAGRAELPLCRDR